MTVLGYLTRSLNDLFILLNKIRKIISQDLEGGGRSLLQSTVLAFAWRDRGKPG
jgi:hypothetical protein